MWSPSRPAGARAEPARAVLRRCSSRWSSVVLAIVGVISRAAVERDLRRASVGRRCAAVAEYVADTFAGAHQAREAPAAPPAPAATPSTSSPPPSTRRSPPRPPPRSTSPRPTARCSQLRPAARRRASRLGVGRVPQGRGWVGEVDAPGRAAPSGARADQRRLRRPGRAVRGRAGLPLGLGAADRAAANLALYLGLGARLGVAGTYVVSRVVKRRTRGLAPEIAGWPTTARRCCTASARACVAVGTDGRVTMVNDAARRPAGLAGDAVGRR